MVKKGLVASKTSRIMSKGSEHKSKGLPLVKSKNLNMRKNNYSGLKHIKNLNYNDT